MDGKVLEELMFTASGESHCGKYDSGDQCYPGLGELATPAPSPTSPSLPSWSQFSAKSTGSDDFLTFFPSRIMTNQGKEMSRMGTPANSLNPLFPGSPCDFKYTQPINNFMPMPPTNSTGSGGNGRRDPPSVRMGLTKRHPTKYNFCVFCKNNDEDESVYLQHTLKDDNGMITCPILWRYKCPLCGATGPVSHTVKYCPKNKGDKYHENYASITELKALRSSTGKTRGARSVADLTEPGVPVLTPIGSPVPGGSVNQRPMRPVLGSGASGSITPMLGELINNQRRQGQPTLTRSIFSSEMLN